MNKIYLVYVLMVVSLGCFLRAEESVPYPTVTLNYNDILQMDPAMKERLWYRKLEQAKLCVHLKDYDGAEKNYWAIFEDSSTLGEVRRAVMLDMVHDVYAPQVKLSKIIVVYEKFSEEYPKDPMIAQVLIKLGQTYRDTGLITIALTKFFAVMQSALSIQPSQIQQYKKQVTIAQQEIVDTYFSTGDYANALHVIDRIRPESLLPAAYVKMRYSKIKCAYELNNYTNVIAEASEFIRKYNGTEYIPECYFMLARAYRVLRKDTDAVRVVIEMLQNKGGKGTMQTVWQNWQKRTVNDIANDFYNHNNYNDALQIYQLLVPINSTPEWQLPIVYQIGMCFERMEQFALAGKAYKFVVDTRIDARGTPDPSLSALKEMAKWRLHGVEWSEQTRAKVNDLTGSNGQAWL